jgi:guanylate kinase
MFMYNPGRDEFCPCPQAGLAFKRRQVLKIIDDSDTDWWQAQLDTTRLVGLVPSPRMQERRPAARAAALSAQQQKIEHDAAKKRKSLIKRLTSRKSSKRSATQMAAAQIEAEVLKKSPATEDPYVEVRKEKPQAGQKRPLVLVGASQISGRNELKQKLVSDYPSRFGVTVPHTTRPMRSGEVDGRDYIFTTRDTMEKLVNEGRFVEHGEFQGNLYGTSIDTIKAVVESGRVCLLDVHPHTLKNLRYYKPTPLVVFIKPPSLEKLKQTRGDANLSDEQLERMVENSNKIDTNYGHFFDFSLSFDTLESTYEQLKALLDKSESEDYWAPVVRSNTTKPTSSTA